MTKFQVNQKYYARSVCDHDCVFYAEIIRRTEKTVYCFIDGKKELKAFRVSIHNGNEMFFPHGRYSMAPIVTSEKIVPDNKGFLNFKCQEKRPAQYFNVGDGIEQDLIDYMNAGHSFYGANLEREFATLTGKFTIEFAWHGNKYLCVKKEFSE